MLEFFSYPLVVTVIGVALGTGLLGWLSERRSQHETLRVQGLQLTWDVADLLNRPLAALMGDIRRGQTLSPELSGYIGDLFVNRFAVRMKVEALLGSDALWLAYEELLRQFQLLAQILEDPDRISIDDFGAESRALASRWKITLDDRNESLSHEELAVLTRARLLFQRSFQVLKAENQRLLAYGSFWSWGRRGTSRRIPI
jgi:hypothetical protein